MRAAAISAAILSLACHDNGPPRGTLTGNVVLQDTWANTLSDFSGVTVSIDGGSNHAFTDASGAWRIDGVLTGIHDIAFTKSGFGTVHLARQAVFATTMTVPRVVMAIAPTQQASIDTVRIIPADSGTSTAFLVGSISPNPPSNAKLVSAVLFVGSSDAVSPDTSTYTTFYTYTNDSAASPPFFFVLSAKDLRDKFPSGSRVYATAYVTAASCTCVADTTRALKPAFTNLGPRSNVVQLTVP